MSVGSLLCRVTRVIVPAHVVPVMLVLIYAAPGALGLYVLRDRYAALFLLSMGISIVAYYVGYLAVARTQPYFRSHLILEKFRFSAHRLEVAGLVIIAAYLFLVLYLAWTAERVALFDALRLKGAADLTSAREAFVQSRTGAERLLVYVHTILFRAVLPVVVVFLYMRQNPWRHPILGVLLFTSLLSLEKSLSLFLLIPLLTYFLLANRAVFAGRVLWIVLGALGMATVLATGVLSEVSSRSHNEEIPAVTESLDRKNLFWVIRAMSTASSPASRENYGRWDLFGRPADSDAAAWASLRLRNRLLNGAMQINRISRGQVRDGRREVLDHWFANESVGGKLSYQQVADAPPGFTHSIKVSVGDGYPPKEEEAFELRQTIEGFRVRDLAFGAPDAQDVSVSFWVKASIPGTYNLTLGNGIFTRSHLTTYSVAAANVWEHKLVAVPGDTRGNAKLRSVSSAASIVLSFNLGTGTAWRTPLINVWQSGFGRQSPSGVVSLVENPGAALQFTGVQLEKGPNATPFEHRTYETELELDARFAPRDALPRSAAFMLNRVLWIPYITGYDWFRYQDEILEGKYLYGRTAGPVAWFQGEERFAAEKEIFKYQYGQSATPTATANAVFFADAYLNFGWPGVIVYSLLLGVIFGLLSTSASLPVASVTVMSSFGVVVASFTANLLSGGLLVLLLLAFVSRDSGISNASHGGSVLGDSARGDPACGVLRTL